MFVQDGSMDIPDGEPSNDTTDNHGSEAVGSRLHRASPERDRCAKLNRQFSPEPVVCPARRDNY